VQVDIENVAAAVATVIGAGGAGALITNWWKNRRADRKQQAALQKEADLWDRESKVKEEEFITGMRRKLVTELKNDLDSIRKRLDERENAERELRHECDSLRRECESLRRQGADLKQQHARCEEENRDLRHKVRVLERRVNKIQHDSDEAEEAEAEGREVTRETIRETTREVKHRVHEDMEDTAGPGGRPTGEDTARVDPHQGGSPGGGT